MSFDSLTFFFIYCAVFFLYSVLREKTPRLLAPLFLITSIVCYAMAGWGDLALITSVLAVNYLLSFGAKDRRILTLALTLNIACLATFKYRGFFLNELGVNQDIFSTGIVIPLGISFYIFHIIAYQIDLYRGHAKFITGFAKFSLFVVFFPQLIAGPILRANQLAPQLERVWRGNPPIKKLYAYGLALCLCGLTKKIIFADSIAPEVDAIFSQLPAHAWIAWQGAILFGFQLYFDFSGYSDIAIGLAYLVGIRLPNNFRTPYFTISPSEFWHRWHITLSRWIRDYLYIPLGGSQSGGLLQQILILLFVMALAGLWHGANWTFILWGLAWGLYGVAERLIRRANTNLYKSFKPLFLIFHLGIIFILWVWFRAPSASYAFDYTKIMLGLEKNLISPPYNHWSVGIWGVALSFFTLMSLHGLERYADRPQVLWRLRKWNGPFLWSILAALCFWLVMIPKMNTNPFIYFRF